MVFLLYCGLSWNNHIWKKRTGPQVRLNTLTGNCYDGVTGAPDNQHDIVCAHNKVALCILSFDEA